jgi:hypothetical protein
MIVHGQGNLPLEQKILVSNICVASIPNYMRAMRTHCPICTKYIPYLFYHFRLIGIFGTNTGYTQTIDVLYFYLIYLIFLIGVGF